MRQRKKLEDESMKYEELRNNICMLRDNGVAEFKSLVNVGRDFFVQARVQQSEMLVVVLGAGVSMELSREEVLLFVDAKQRALHRCACAAQHALPLLPTRPLAPALTLSLPLMARSRHCRSLESCAQACAQISQHCRQVQAHAPAPAGHPSTHPLAPLALARRSHPSPRAYYAAPASTASSPPPPSSVCPSRRRCMNASSKNTDNTDNAEHQHSLMSKRCLGSQ